MIKKMKKNIIARNKKNKMDITIQQKKQINKMNCNKNKKLIT